MPPARREEHSSSAPRSEKVHIGIGVDSYGNRERWWRPAVEHGGKLGQRPSRYRRNDDSGGELSFADQTPAI
jgi:hypothetical protein